MTSSSINLWAVIETSTNKVINTVVWNGTDPWTPPEGSYLIEITGMPAVTIGCSYNKVNSSFDCS